jgi:GT2 family glycosyltransferase
VRPTVAVVVHWRDPAETLGCLESVRADGIDAAVVVDNAGDTGLEAALRATGPSVTYLRPPENLGYAGGGNLGIHAAIAAGADVVLLLNNDARLVSGADAAARRRLASDARIAVVGGRVRSREDPERLWLAWGDVTFGRSLVALHGADVRDGPEWASAREVDWVAGCALWLARKAVEALGDLDEGFFAYHEEVEWCARARRGGWRVVYEPAAIVSHTGRGSDGPPASIRIRKYFAARNAVLFVRRYGSPLQRARHAASVAVGLAAELVWHGVRGTADGTRWKLRGVRDGLTGRRPPFEELGLRAP